LSLSRTLKRLDLGRKKKKFLVASEQATERVQKLRYELQSWLDTIDVKNLVFIDETGINLSMTRLYGRGEGGARVTACFLVFIEKILLPQLWVGAIVAMDNLPVYYAEIAKTLIGSVGAKVKILPPYFPDLSPIELCWSKLKEIIRSDKARTIEALDAAK